VRVLLENDRGDLTLYRLRPWHQLAARFLATRLDRELAGGTRPEAAPTLAARAIRLTSTQYRRDLATSLQRIIAARSRPGSGHALPEAGRTRLGAERPPAMPAYSRAGIARPPHVPVQRTRISRSAPELAELAGRLIQPGPVPARGVAMVSQLVTDGGGPLYRQASHGDLGALATRAVRALDQMAWAS
jgi:hypothetical protein